jgi:GNAT superfamily N-acetyltransferase
LFVHPEAQGRGYGSALHDVMLAWLLQQGAQRLWLGTGPGTQALGFYQRRGWVLCGTQQAGKDLVLEQRLEPPGLG